MGSWRIVEMAVLRKLATNFAVGLDGMAGTGDAGRGGRGAG
jgi:hypothetical protein